MYIYIFKGQCQRSNCSALTNFCFADSESELCQWTNDQVRLSLGGKSGLVQERRNSSALAMELHLCTNPSK